MTHKKIKPGLRLPSLELSEDQMVEELAEIQRLARLTLEATAARPYDQSIHEKTCNDLFKKMKWLALKGDGT
ncbi:hypothetical protein LCGC14_2757020 [marine sediment metagenome]|uniref:Uncharacterized protein n=1 Tax=marine sediment metagenome TaxID=412755 RepID=A0A0F8ZLZ4_9ZZZZ